MNKRRGGFLLIEVLLAIVILSLIFVTLFTSLSFLTNRTDRAKFDAEASDLMQQAVEVTRAYMTSNWESVDPGNYKLVFDGVANRYVPRSGDEPLLKGRYTRSIYVSQVCRGSGGIEEECVAGSNIDEKSKKIEVSLIWNEVGIQKEANTSLLVYRVGN